MFQFQDFLDIYQFVDFVARKLIYDKCGTSVRIWVFSDIFPYLFISNLDMGLI